MEEPKRRWPWAAAVLIAAGAVLITTGRMGFYLVGVMSVGIGLVLLVRRAQLASRWRRAVAIVLVTAVTIVGWWLPNPVLRDQLLGHQVWSSDVEGETPLVVNGRLQVAQSDGLVTLDISTGETVNDTSVDRARFGSLLSDGGSALDHFGRLLVWGTSETNTYEVWLVTTNQATRVHSTVTHPVTVLAASSTAVVVSECGPEPPSAGNDCTVRGIRTTGGELWHRSLDPRTGPQPLGQGLPTLAHAIDWETEANDHILLDPQSGVTVGFAPSSSSPFADHPEALTILTVRGRVDHPQIDGLSLTLTDDTLTASRDNEALWQQRVAGISSDDRFSIANGVIAIVSTPTMWSPYLHWNHGDKPRQVTLLDATTGEPLSSRLIPDDEDVMLYPIGGSSFLFRSKDGPLTLIR